MKKTTPMEPAAKRHLLFLVHRLPYPPNKGDKISSFNLLRYFSRYYRIHLGCFVDNPDDWQYVDPLREYCHDICAQNLNPRRARIASLRGLLTGEALTIPYYRKRALAQWVRRVAAEENVDAVFIYSGSMAQYLPQLADTSARTVLDLEDVDSEKWREYAGGKAWPLSWLYRREARTLFDFERRMAAAVDATVFISAAEAELFRRLAPEVADTVHHRVQGVDAAYFDPALDHANPLPSGSRCLVFTGAMDYWPNVDAVTWFADHVLPGVRDRHPQTELYIVGMNPSEEVRRLGRRDGVTVTGTVDDVRPYLAHAAAVVVPLRIARGIQNKVLEAMAMARPVVATVAAMTGIAGPDSMQPRISDHPEALRDALVALLEQPTTADPEARNTVLAHYDWNVNLHSMKALLEGRAGGDSSGF